MVMYKVYGTYMYHICIGGLERVQQMVTVVLVGAGGGGGGGRVFWKNCNSFLYLHNVLATDGKFK